MSWFVRRAQVAARLRAQQQQAAPVEVPAWGVLLKMDVDELAALAGRVGLDATGGAMSIRSALNNYRKWQ